LITEEDPTPKHVEWDDFLKALLGATDAWYHLSGGTAAEVHELGRVIDMPATALDIVFGNASFPRAHGSAPFSMLFVWLPTLESGKPATIERRGVLLLTNGRLTITLCPTPSVSQAALAHPLASRQASRESFAVRTLFAVLRGLLDRHQQVVDELERELRDLEALPLRDSTAVFFEQAFWLKRELTSIKADLWRLKGILQSLPSGRVAFAGLDSTQLAGLDPLTDEVSYLYETVDNLREGVLALIDLHMNVVSFEINRFMRVLAVVSVLGLIPAIIGGLLGMNVAGNPWEITLSEVAFGVSMGMLFCFWVFLIKGWLR
jgi:Mg2+ and Co2+ transporter CorA